MPTYYFDSVNGSDSNSGTSIDQPKKNYDVFSGVAGDAVLNADLNSGLITTDTSKNLEANGSLVIPNNATLANVSSVNPLAIGTTDALGVVLKNGKTTPGFTPLGAYQAVLPRQLVTRNLKL